MACPIVRMALGVPRWALLPLRPMEIREPATKGRGSLRHFHSSPISTADLGDIDASQYSRLLQDPAASIQTLARPSPDSVYGSASSQLPGRPGPSNVSCGRATDTILSARLKLRLNCHRRQIKNHVLERDAVEDRTLGWRQEGEWAPPRSWASRRGSRRLRGHRQLSGLDLRSAIPYCRDAEP